MNFGSPPRAACSKQILRAADVDPSKRPLGRCFGDDAGDVHHGIAPVHHTCQLLGAGDISRARLDGVRPLARGFVGPACEQAHVLSRLEKMRDEALVDDT